MRRVQRSVIAIGVVAVAGLGAVPGAPAKKPKVAVKIAPATPTLKTPITVSFKAPKAPRGNVIWTVTFEPSARMLACTGGTVFERTSRARSGRTVSFTFRPLLNAGSGDGVWCPGKARITVTRNVPGRGGTVSVARRDVRIALGPGETQPQEGFVPVKITALGGSTLTASAPGRPDRSAQLTGVLRGRIPSGFKPNTDVNVEQISGSLTPLAAGLAQAVFPPDPLCPDTNPPATFDAVPASSSMLLKASGDTTWNLTLNGAPSQLFGCGPAGPLAGTTTLPLAGRVGPKGLLGLQQTGSVTGITLPGGSQGGLAASLVLNVDLSGNG